MMRSRAGREALPGSVASSRRERRAVGVRYLLYGMHSGNFGLVCFCFGFSYFSDELGAIDG